MLERFQVTNWPEFCHLVWCRSREILFGLLLALIGALAWPSLLLTARKTFSEINATLPSSLSSLDTSWHVLRSPSHPIALVALLVLTIVALYRAPMVRAIRGLGARLRQNTTAIWATSFFICAISTGPFLRGGLTLAATTLYFWSCIFELHQSGPALPRNADDAISNLEDDKLNRQTFVRQLARKIAEECPSVLALVGPYGAGKTSIFNLLSKELNKPSSALPNGKIVVAQFTTWLPGDEKTLILALFNTIARTLQPSLAVGQLRTKLETYAKIMVGLIPHAPRSFGALFNGPSQEEQLQKIKERLDGLPVRRVVLLLDDLDRMQPRELEALLKLIRAAGAYPKLTFVCAFHKAALARILAGWEPTHDVNLDLTVDNRATSAGYARGQIAPSSEPTIYEYLEKFFPIQIPVPKLDETILGKLFDEHFEKFCRTQSLLTTDAERQTFNEQFKPLWDGYFKYALDNPRKLSTYFNALRWSFPQIKREVNLFDYMLLELLREIEPSAYEQLFLNRKYFYYPEWEITTWPERLLDDQRHAPEEFQAYEFVLRGLHGRRREFAIGLLSALFPRFSMNRTERAIGRGKPSETEAEKHRRIFHPAFFSIYFSFQVSEQFFSGDEQDKLLSLLNATPSEEDTANHFAAYLTGFPELKRINVLDRLFVSAEQLSTTSARGIATALAKNSANLAADFLNLGERASALRLIMKIATRFQNSNEITLFLKSIIFSSESNGFARDVWIFGTSKDRNNLFTNWDNVSTEEIKAAFVRRMRSKYYPGSGNSIYAGKIEDFSPLFAWGDASPDDLQKAQDYLRSEFQARPSNVVAHVRWLLPSIARDSDSKTRADRLFPFVEIKTLLEEYLKTGRLSTNDQQVAKQFEEFLRGPASSS